MKMLAVFITFVLSTGLLASEKPRCKDPEVILSPVKIPCEEDIRLDVDFDIPELQIDMSELEKILLGIESSGGGRTVGPMQAGNRRTLQFNYSCQARLLIDGGKTISYLSTMKLTLNQLKPIHALAAQAWKHYVIKGNNINSKKLYPITKAPQINFDRFQLSIATPSKNRFLFQLCTRADDQEQFCQQKNRSIQNGFFSLTNQSMQTKEDVIIQQTLQVRCLRRL